MWTGSTSTFRSLIGFVLDDGSYWVFYSAPYQSAFFGGVVQGSGKSQNGSFSSADAKDFNVEGQGIGDATVSASYVVKQSLNGVLGYPGSNPSVTFTTAYNTAYDATPSLAAIAGNYAGYGHVAGGSEPTSVSVAASGAVSGIGSLSGCRFTGTVAPRSTGNIYSVSITFGGTGCANGTSTVTGMAYFDPATRLLRSAALNSLRSNGYIFIGTK